jgi:hypothetical protein
MKKAVIGLLSLAGAAAEVYFEEDFSDGMDKWVPPAGPRRAPSYPLRRMQPAASRRAAALKPPWGAMNVSPLHPSSYAGGLWAPCRARRWASGPSHRASGRPTPRQPRASPSPRICGALTLATTAPRPVPAPLSSCASYAPPTLLLPPPHSFYSITAPLDKPATSKGKDLVIQLSAKIENHQYAFCGGGYIKLLPAGTKAETFGGNDPYHIMFGPDLCGYDVSHVHLIFNHKVSRRAGWPFDVRSSSPHAFEARAWDGCHMGLWGFVEPQTRWRLPPAEAVRTGATMCWRVFARCSACMPLALHCVGWDAPVGCQICQGGPERKWLATSGGAVELPLLPCMRHPFHREPLLSRFRFGHLVSYGLLSRMPTCLVVPSSPPTHRRLPPHRHSPRPLGRRARTC